MPGRGGGVRNKDTEIPGKQFAGACARRKEGIESFQISKLEATLAEAIEPKKPSWTALALGSEFKVLFKVARQPSCRYLDTPRYTD